MNISVLDKLPENFDVSKEKLRIIDEFHKELFYLLKLCKNKGNSPELEWLTTTMNIGQQIDPVIIISKCKDKILSYSKYIIEKNEQFFYAETFSKYIKDDQNKQFIDTLVQTTKHRYKDATDEEKEIVWGALQRLLKRTAEYQKILLLESE